MEIPYVFKKSYRLCIIKILYNIIAIILVIIVATIKNIANDKKMLSSLLLTQCIKNRISVIYTLIDENSSNILQNRFISYLLLYNIVYILYNNSKFFSKSYVIKVKNFIIYI